MRIHFLLCTAATCAALTAIPARAHCAGTPDYMVCIDSAGNHSTSIRYGDSSHASGGNFSTGSTWSHDTRSIGNTTFSEGRRNGRAWTRTDVDLGRGTRATYGTDSRGRPFGSVCGPYGCY